MADLRDHEGEIATALGRLGKRAPFADVLAERAAGAGLRLDTRSTTPSVEARLGGAIFRIWDGRHWVEAATSSLDARGLGGAVTALEQAAAKSGGHHPVPGVSSTTKKEWTTSTAHPMREVPVEEILSLAKDARGWAMSVPGVLRCPGRYRLGGQRTSLPQYRRRALLPASEPRAGRPLCDRDGERPRGVRFR